MTADSQKESVKKIVLFGGAFSPFHLGHLKICQEVQAKLNPDFFYLIPYQKNPYQTPKKIIKSHHRVLMIQEQIKNFDFLNLSDFELKQKSISYSYLTCQYFRKIYPNDKIFFILGTDSLNDFFNWNKPNKILKSCNLLHLIRKNQQLNQNIEKIISNNNIFEDNYLFGKIYQLSTHIPHISSTEIRKNLNQYFREKKDKDKLNQLSSLIDKKILNYLIQHFEDLY